MIVSVLHWHWWSTGQRGKVGEGRRYYRDLNTAETPNVFLLSVVFCWLSMVQYCPVFVVVVVVRLPTVWAGRPWIQVRYNLSYRVLGSKVPPPGHVNELGENEQ